MDTNRTLTNICWGFAFEAKSNSQQGLYLKSDRWQPAYIFRLQSRHRQDACATFKTSFLLRSASCEGQESYATSSDMVKTPTKLLNPKLKLELQLSSTPIHRFADSPLLRFIPAIYRRLTTSDQRLTTSDFSKFHHVGKFFCPRKIFPYALPENSLGLTAYLSFSPFE